MGAASLVSERLHSFRWQMTKWSLPGTRSTEQLISVCVCVCERERIAAPINLRELMLQFIILASWQCADDVIRPRVRMWSAFLRLVLIIILDPLSNQVQSEDRLSGQKWTLVWDTFEDVIFTCGHFIFLQYFLDFWLKFCPWSDDELCPSLWIVVSMWITIKLSDS